MKNLNYGAVGNCRTAALISEKGSVDFFCLPEFDSPTAFARLLDEEKGGFFSFEVPADYFISQKYLPDTNILCTEFKGKEGGFEVLDFMPRYHTRGDDYYLPPELYRYVRVLYGRPRMKVHYAPALDYARGKTRHIAAGNHLESVCSDNPKEKIYFYSSLPLEKILHGEEIVLHEDGFFLVSDNEKLIGIDLQRVRLEYQRTRVYWMNWTNRSKKLDRYNGVIQRSMLVLKLMSCYSGSVLAALTTSLPETPGEVRNWDYRFCWMRDASMSIEILLRMGHSGAARRFMSYLQNIFVTKREDFQIMYGIRGERVLTEKILPHLSGYEGSGPVRVGNAAYSQRQHDSFGYLMDVMYQYYCYFPGTLDEIEYMWELVKALAGDVQRCWRQADKGIWEIRGRERHFVFSKVMCWVALDRAAKIAAMLGRGQQEASWRGEAEEIRREVLQKGWNGELQSFTQAYGNRYMDASLLLMERYGFIEKTDEKFISTVRRVRQMLLKDGLMYRYDSPDDFGVPSSAFTICTFWLIRALYAIGEKEESARLLERTLSYANHLGLFSEDLDFRTKRLLGNFPQAYSHLALIDSCLLFAREKKISRFIRP